MVQNDVQIALCVGRERLPKVLDQFAVEGTDLRSRNRSVVFKSVPTTHVHRGGHQALIHWQREVTITTDAGSIVQCFINGGTQRDPNVLGRVVIVDVKVAGGFHVEIDE